MPVAEHVVVPADLVEVVVRKRPRILPHERVIAIVEAADFDAGGTDRAAADAACQPAVRHRGDRGLAVEHSARPRQPADCFGVELPGPVEPLKEDADGRRVKISRSGEQDYAIPGPGHEPRVDAEIFPTLRKESVGCVVDRRICRQGGGHASGTSREHRQRGRKRDTKSEGSGGEGSHGGFREDGFDSKVDPGATKDGRHISAAAV